MLIINHVTCSLSISSDLNLQDVQRGSKVWLKEQTKQIIRQTCTRKVLRECRPLPGPPTGAGCLQVPGQFCSTKWTLRWNPHLASSINSSLIKADRPHCCNSTLRLFDLSPFRVFVFGFVCRSIFFCWAWVCKAVTWRGKVADGSRQTQGITPEEPKKKKKENPGDWMIKDYCEKTWVSVYKYLSVWHFITTCAVVHGMLLKILFLFIYSMKARRAATWCL